MPENAYGREFETNPTFTFQLNLEPSQILSNHVYIRIVGTKPCELLVTPQMVLNKAMANVIEKPGKRHPRELRALKDELSRYYRRNDKSKSQLDRDYLHENINEMT